MVTKEIKEVEEVKDPVTVVTEDTGSNQVNAERYEQDGNVFVKFELICVNSKNRSTGEKYLKYYAYDKKGKRREVRFIKGLLVPTQNCFIHVPLDKINLDKSRRKLVMWFKEITATEVKLSGYEPYNWEDLKVKQDDYL